MEKREKILKKLTQAIRVREGGKIEYSGQLFQDLIKKASSLRNSKDLEDRNLYVKIYGEWIVQLRHEAKRFYFQAIKESRKLYNYSRNNNLNNPGAIRGLSNTLMNLEDYEIAEGYLREMLGLIPSIDSAKSGDAMAHLARCLLRTGKIDDAYETIKEAIAKIEANGGGANSLEIAVWKSHALRVTALILNAKGMVKEAARFAQDSLEIAKKAKAFQRIQEVTEINKYLESKLKSK